MVQLQKRAKWMTNLMYVQQKMKTQICYITENRSYLLYLLKSQNPAETNIDDPHKKKNITNMILKHAILL